jgi:autotransporter-associated beta strand protein
VVNKLGSGTSTLSGINTFTGRTTIDAGTLSISQDANLGAAPGSFAANQLTLSHGGRLEVTSGFTMAANRGMTVLPGAGSAGVIDLAAAQVLTIPGGIVKNGTVLELKGGAGSVFHLNGVISGVSPNSDLIVNGGTTNLGAANTYDGPTFIRNGGTLNAEVAGALPAATRTALTLDDTGSGSSRLSLGADNTVASLTGAASSSVLLGANALTLGATSGSTSFAGTISGLGGSIIKDGASTQTLTGTNTFTGATTVSAGSLELGAGGSLVNTSSVTVNSGGTLLVSGGGANQINNAADVTLDGNGVGTTGNIALDGISAIDETVGALTLSSSSIIDFGTFGAGHTLRFADSSALSGAWSGTLSIYHWTGSPFLGGGPDHLFFGTDAGGLGGSQLNQISFYSGGFGSAFLGTGGILSNGEVVPIPEPSSVFASLLLFGLAGWRERRNAEARHREERLARAGQ